MNLPAELKKFIKEQTWIFAKTLQMCKVKVELVT